MKKETAGKIATDLMYKSDIPDHSVHEQMQEMLEGYEKNVIECIERGKKLFPQDFFIVAETKREKALKNIIRQYFIPRLSCPTPCYDNTVYKYHAKDEHLEFLWVLPDKEAHKYLRENALTVPSEYKELLKYVLDDADGTLLVKCMKLNEEIL